MVRHWMADVARKPAEHDYHASGDHQRGRR
jgi:hypothetical protein